MYMLYVNYLRFHGFLYINIVLFQKKKKIKVLLSKRNHNLHRPHQIKKILELKSIRMIRRHHQRRPQPPQRLPRKRPKKPNRKRKSKLLSAVNLQLKNQMMTMMSPKHRTIPLTVDFSSFQKKSAEVVSKQSIAV